MRIFGRLVMARDGWPLEGIKNRPVLNALRFVLHAALWRTFIAPPARYEKTEDAAEGQGAETDG